MKQNKTSKKDNNQKHTRMLHVCSKQPNTTKSIHLHVPPQKLAKWCQKKTYKLSIWDKAYRQILGDLIPDGCNESFPDLRVESGPRFVGSGPPLYNPKNFTSRIARWTFGVFNLQV